MKMMHGAFCFGLLEHIANAGRTDADEHFDEVGTAEAEERHARFAGDRFGEQRFAGSRRADEQHALGNAAAEQLIFFRRLQELDDLAEFVDGFFDAGHVLERDFDVFLGEEFAAAAAERHRRAGPAHAANHEHEEHHQEGRHQQQWNVIQQRVRRAGDAPIETLLREQVGELAFLGQPFDAQFDVLLFLTAGDILGFAVAAAGGRRLVALPRNFRGDERVADLDIGEIRNPETAALGAAGVWNFDGPGVAFARGFDELQQVAPANLLLGAAVENGDHQQQEHAEPQHVPNQVAATLLGRLFVGWFIAGRW